MPNLEPCYHFSTKLTLLFICPIFTNKFNNNNTETILQSNYVNKEHHHTETYTIGADWFINKANSIGIKTFPLKPQGHHAF